MKIKSCYNALIIVAVIMSPVSRVMATSGQN